MSNGVSFTTSSTGTSLSGTSSSFSSSAAAPSGSAAPFRPDGRCGTGFGNAQCNPLGAGPCCSQYGYCGSSDSFCLVEQGCQSGCVDGTPSASSGASSAGSPSTSTSASTPSGLYRPDGRCGTAFGNAQCNPLGAAGPCCSQYGYCGSSDSFCLASQGCQNGCVGGTSSGSSGPSLTGTSSAGSYSLAGSSSSSAAPSSASSGSAVVYSTNGRCG